MHVDYFLKIEGIEGESQDAKHKGEIEIDSFTFGESQNGSMASGGGGGVGKVQMQDFSFSMAANKASPKLFLACAQGEHLKKAVLICRKAGKEQQEYLKWTFSDVLVTSYETSGSAGEGIPSEQISLGFAKVECEYKPQNGDGSLAAPIRTGYDLKQNSAA